MAKKQETSTETGLKNYRLNFDADLLKLRTDVLGWLHKEFPQHSTLEQLCCPRPENTMDDCFDITPAIPFYERILHAVSEVRKTAGLMSRALLNDMQQGLTLYIGTNVADHAPGVFFALTTGVIEEAYIPKNKMSGLIKILTPYVAHNATAKAS